MKFCELLAQDEFTFLTQEIGEFAEEILREYINEIKRKFPCTQSKEIFDAVWGPVEFNPAEVVILDSPLVQRLRKIKQLGLASFVYCGADYSRFSHTIGVFYLADRMSNIINKRVKENNDYSFIQAAKLAALFHDVGHMYYSHVSEYYFTECNSFKRFDKVKKAIFTFSNAIGKKVALHEMISVILVHSLATRELISAVQSYFEGIQIRQSKDLELLIEYISCMIVGVANDSNILPYYKIINGSVDADKCDYLSRDSHTTNVPVAVDIFRLIQKLNIEQSMSHDQKNNRIWNDDANNAVIYSIPTIKSSAEEALNQLFMARTIMFKSVYYHQKVRTAEVMLRNIFDELNEIETEEVINFKKILLSTDDTFGNYCYTLLKRDQDDEFNQKLNSVVKKLILINNRRLLKRASSISNEIIEADKEELLIFTTDILQMNKRDAILKIEEDTRKEYIEISKLLGVGYKEDADFMIVEFPKFRPDNAKLDMLISYGNGQVKKASEVFQTETWMNSKESRNKENYLVSDCDDRGIAHLALQKVLFDQYKIVLSDIAATYSKVQMSEIRNYKKTLLHKGYYNSCLILVSDMVLNAFKEDINKIHLKFQTYEGEGGVVISDESIKKYLKQFFILELNEDNCYLLIDGILRILRKALFINRKVFDESMEEIFNVVRVKGKMINICPLGGEKDSAKHLLYYLNDFKNKKEIQIFSSLQNLLEKTNKDDEIVFFDDGAYSGRQVISIFQEYMGIEKAERETDEEHVDELEEGEKQDLFNRKITLAYICFNAENKVNIENDFKQLGINNVHIINAYNMQAKVFDDSQDIFIDNKQRDLVYDKFKDIGVEILRSVKSEDGIYKEKWSKDRVINGALGYNDAQQSVILKSSVPTYTLTPLWLRDGHYKNKLWVPLFIRTNK